MTITTPVPDTFDYWVERDRLTKTATEGFMANARPLIAQALTAMAEVYGDVDLAGQELMEAAKRKMCEHADRATARAAEADREERSACYQREAAARYTAAADKIDALVSALYAANEVTRLRRQERQAALDLRDARRALHRVGA